ncbi:MAG: hypothetical protein E6I70_02910 [Chloroflexi bacterium]|nr:MAG: hypothetical protein E6I70_02910 [Chloroflexota bacterium]
MRAAAIHLPDAVRGAGDDIDALLALTLGEGQFGPHHWRIGSAQRLYYFLKPALPRWATRRLRRLHRRSLEPAAKLHWPAETRYAAFVFEVARQIRQRTNRRSLPFIHFWPHGYRYAFVLTHDVETADGQRRVAELAELDAGFGFRSSFNFVPERYRLDRGLIRELRARGFEVGVHGLRHDGKLFSSSRRFARRVQRINQHLRQLGATGFRSPLTHRNPQWMQALDIGYDLSFFDTDPWEPIPGGTMSIWPFTIGRFVELPYTLVQDYTLTAVLRETTPRLWLEKVEALESYFGQVLLNTHPDYLVDRATRRVYTDFLQAMRSRDGYWQALPHEVAAWWQARRQAGSLADLPGGVVASVDEGGVQLPSSGQMSHRARRDSAVG